MQSPRPSRAADWGTPAQSGGRRRGAARAAAGQVAGRARGRGAAGGWGGRAARLPSYLFILLLPSFLPSFPPPLGGYGGDRTNLTLCALEALVPPRSPVAPGGGARAPTRRGLGGPRRRRKVGGPVCPAAVCLLLVGAAALSPAFVTASFPLTLRCVSVPHPPPHASCIPGRFKGSRTFF